MSENCSGNCSGCGSASSCGEKKSFLENPHKLSHIGKVIGVVSGKGGVGKSLVTSLLAVSTARAGLRTAVMDADITGPSIPKIFGITEKATGSDDGIFPVRSKGGVETMSINELLPDDSDPVIWRGPVISGTVKQFWTDVIWGDIDVMFIDMPPGTGDVPLTIFQSIPLDGIVIVTSPQELVSMIVGKAAKMAQLMNIPVLGIVENFSYALCPDCGKQISIFGESHVQETADTFGIHAVDRLPILPEIASACDRGDIESVDGQFLPKVLAAIRGL